MRHEKAIRLLELARLLASNAEGLTLDEMAQELDTTRRTAERMRNAVRELFPQLEEIDDPPSRRYRLSGGLDSLFQAPDAEELSALRSAAENARVNRVALDVRSSSEALPAPADIVIANILSSPLKLLAPMLGALVAPDGYLVLSGVLERQIAEVADCYDPALNVRSWRTCDGWACLVGRR